MNKLEEYIKKYEDIHSGKSSTVIVENGVATGEATFPFGDGVELVKKAFIFIDDLIKQKDRAVTILDYGCGQALHTFDQNYYGHSLRAPKLVGKTIFSFFPGMIQCYYCYDPAVKRYAIKPSEGTLFDMVILADVMEHIPEEHVDDVIRDAVQYCKPDGFVMFTISGNPAWTHFSNEDGSPGENAHITQKSLEWWTNKINSITRVTTVVMYTNDKIFEKTNGKGNCITVTNNKPSYKVPDALSRKEIIR